MVLLVLLDLLVLEERMALMVLPVFRVSKDPVVQQVPKDLLVRMALMAMMVLLVLPVHRA